MRIIEIEKLSNGAHNNQTTNDLKKVPNGWALIPEDMKIPEPFPFVDIEVENGVVTAMTEGVVPDIEPVSEPSAEDILKVLLGVSK